jgi:hypothetical protein
LFKAKDKGQQEFDDLMSQYHKLVDKKKSILGKSNKTPQKNKIKQELHLKELYRASKMEGSELSDKSEQGPFQKQKNVSRQPFVRQKSILKNSKKNKENNVVPKSKKKGLAFLMDGMDEYQELGVVKKVTFLDTKSELDKDIDEDQGFVPMFNYDNTVLGKSKKSKFKQKVFRFERNEKVKARFDLDPPSIKPKTKARTIKKNKQLQEIQKLVTKQRQKNKPIPKRSKQLKKKNSKPKRIQVQNKKKESKEAKREMSPESEVEFRYDSETDSVRSESPGKPVRVQGSYAIEQQIMNQKGVLNIFKRKHNMGKKSMFKTLDFDSFKEPVSRKEVVKNKQKAMHLNAKKTHDFKPSVKNPFYKLKNLGNRPPIKNLKNNKVRSKKIDSGKTTHAKKPKVEKPSRSSISKVPRNSISKVPEEVNREGKSRPKKSAQPWKDTIEDRVTKLKETLDAKAYLVHESGSDRILISHNTTEKREMASLTKIMTCYSLLRFCNENGIDLTEEYFEVTPKAAAMNGTSAKLMENTYVSIQDLLWGLMLPSGNDAAMCIAENVGRLLRLQTDDLINFQIYSGYNTFQPDFLLFMNLMNVHARELGLYDSFFSNPHGLNNEKNTSTCLDLLKLSLEAMKHPLFRTVVATIEYSGKYYRKKLKSKGKPQNGKRNKTLSDHRQIQIRQKQVLESMNELPNQELDKVSLYSDASSKLTSRTENGVSIKSSKSRGNLHKQVNRKTLNNMPIKKEYGNKKSEKTLFKTKNNKYAKSFTINYQSTVQKMAKMGISDDQQDAFNHHRKKSNLSKLMSKNKNKKGDFMKQMKKLYTKEVEGRRGKPAKSMAHLGQSPKRRKKKPNPSDVDAESQFSDFSDLSRNKMMNSKKSKNMFESPFRQKKDSGNRRQKKANRSSMNLGDSTEIEFSYGRADEQERVGPDFQNDEFIDIQGVGQSRKSLKTDKNQKKARKSKSNRVAE